MMGISIEKPAIALHIVDSQNENMFSEIEFFGIKVPSRKSYLIPIRTPLGTISRDNLHCPSTFVSVKSLCMTD